LINEVVKLVIWIPGANTISQMELWRLNEMGTYGNAEEISVMKNL
jgi:hypothetical protein